MIPDLDLARVQRWIEGRNAEIPFDARDQIRFEIVCVDSRLPKISIVAPGDTAKLNSKVTSPLSVSTNLAASGSISPALQRSPKLRLKASTIASSSGLSVIDLVS